MGNNASIYMWQICDRRKKLNLKIAIDAKLDELEQYFTNLKEVKLIEYRGKLNEHFFVLRNKVDIKRETVLEKYHDNTIKFEETNRSSTNLIEQLDLTENEFRTNFMNKIESHINSVTNIDEYKRRLKELLRNNRSRKKDFVKLKFECESLLDRIQSETIQIEKRFTARLNANKFDELFGDQDEILVGELHLNSFENEETRIYSRKVLAKAAQDECRKGNLVFNSHIKYLLSWINFLKLNCIPIINFIFMDSTDASFQTIYIEQDISTKF